MEEESSIVLTREGKYWRAKDTLSDLSTLGDSEAEAYQLLAEVLALVLDGMTEELRGLGGGELGE